MERQWGFLFAFKAVASRLVGAGFARGWGGLGRPEQSLLLMGSVMGIPGVVLTLSPSRRAGPRKEKCTAG